MPLIREHLCYHGFADTLRSLDSCIGENAETEEKYPVAHFVQTSMLNIRQGNGLHSDDAVATRNNDAVIVT